MTLATGGAHLHQGYPVRKDRSTAARLILALCSGLTQADYDTLSRIAPTVAQPAEHGDYGIPWQGQTITSGQAIGKADEAEQLVADVEALFAKARADHPEFAGQSAVMAALYEDFYFYGFYFYSEQDVRSRLLMDLGFTYPTELRQFVGAEEYCTAGTSAKSGSICLTPMFWYGWGWTARRRGTSWTPLRCTAPRGWSARDVTSTSRRMTRSTARPRSSRR